MRATGVAERGPASRDGDFLRVRRSIRVHVVPTQMPPYEVRDQTVTTARKEAG